MTTACSTPPVSSSALVPPSPAILEANLAALSRGSPEAARLIRGSTARADLEFIRSEESAADGPAVLAAQIGAGPSARALASRRRPLAEARKLAEDTDISGSGCIVVSGFGLGHHVGALGARMRRTGVIVCFEPDVALLRAVLERIDHSAWIGACNLALLTDADDSGAMSQALQGMEAVVGLGVTLAAHPEARTRLGKSATRFETNFKQVVENISTTVVTTMAQVDVTVRNLTMNLDRYVSCPGVADLKDAAAGRAAIVVSAGPSLRRNIDLLTDPAVRGRFVVIAVQTVLKTLLARGIRPDYVTALDYHEISRRFYEGLGAADVEGITLVAEPQANPAILDAFPGSVRCTADSFLDELLGPELAKETGDGRATIPLGATVAHLAYYLARHLGCDPVVLIGQDLGFTDGQYYAAGAAIHQVWAGELNEFNTLEMMEWQRIVRMRATLRRATDTLGRPIYTDQQMNTYLGQFERDFKRDAERGLTIIDATEGGVGKRHTRAMTLRQVVEDAGRAGVPGWAAPAGAASDTAPTLRAAADRVRRVRQEVWQVGEQSRKTARLLREMLDQHQDQPRVNQLIGAVEAIRDRVTALKPAFSLVQRLNQTGIFRRFRADRSIHLDETLTDLERQRRQIERDVENVSWLADAADELGRILDDAIASLPANAGGRSAPKRTRDAAPVETGAATGTAVGISTRPRVAAIIPVLHDRGHLGTSRDLSRPFLLNQSPLRLTLRRLARCRNLQGVVLLTDDAEATRRLAMEGGTIPGLRISILVADLDPLRDRQRGIRGARLWAESCWRGGIGGLTCYDEVLDAALVCRALGATELGPLDGALLVGCDWCLVDPELCDALIERHSDRPAHHKLTFTQAPPGLAGCVVGRPLVETLASAWGASGAGASLASLLSYNPAAPILDPIAHSFCVGIEPVVRDSLIRFVPDSPARHALLAGALADLGEKLIEADAGTIARRVAKRAALTGAPDLPAHAILELCTGRRTSGRRGHWERGSIGAVERTPMARSLAERILLQLAARPDAAVTLAGAGDPLLHPEAIEVVEAAARAGIAGIHVRTDLLCERELLDRLLTSGVDVISVDLMADNADTYRAIMGVDRFEQARGNLVHLLEARARLGGVRSGGLPRPWIVPRITRCDAAYGDVEGFFDRWLTGAGAAAIDPLPLEIPGERIAPLPRPDSVRRRDLRRVMTINSDGSVPIAERDLHGTGPIVGSATREPIAKLWRELAQARRLADTAMEARG